MSAVCDRSCDRCHNHHCDRSADHPGNHICDVCWINRKGPM